MRRSGGGLAMLAAITSPRTTQCSKTETYSQYDSRPGNLSAASGHMAHFLGKEEKNQGSDPSHTPAALRGAVNNAFWHHRRAIHGTQNCKKSFS
ncbi:MAG: hypothetical protein GYA55_13455 [SAR324 cluster bacterium]|uniref:Uncharacterized protein n=1 Tax=SAR324 cluster bacterium TaxID=2024889 RepID=A0A7X9IKX4_9DELT|nr:hypothetical protein [SAR324 cluster bacterium]